jgi:hypothetical protein
MLVERGGRARTGIQEGERSVWGSGARQWWSGGCPNSVAHQLWLSVLYSRRSMMARPLAMVA